MTQLSVFVDEEDFDQCIRENILPLIPTANDTPKLIKLETEPTKPIVFLDDDGLHIDFSPGRNPQEYFLRVNLSTELNSTKTFRKVFEKIVSTREDARDFVAKTKKSTKKLDHRQYLRGLDAISCQLGICQSLADRRQDAKLLSEIITILSSWSSKKYEGKNVPFGIVIDFDKISIPTRKINFIDFLESNYCAVFTDGVFSAVILDREGKLCEYKHLYPFRKNTSKYNQTTLSPTRFCGFSELCDLPDKIGIISLINGDILLFRNKTLMFAKRRGKWTNFDWSRFFNPFLYKYSPDYYKNNLKKRDKGLRLSKSVYISLLDVSFAHNSACLGLACETQGEILTTLENCNFFSDPDPAIKGPIEQHKLKLSVLMEFVNYRRASNGMKSSSSKKFYMLPDQLRTELLSLDGATVIDWKGNIHAAGAIISVDSGIMGGGRTTAAKKLSEYGLAFKVSEDGSITGFHENVEMFKIE